MKVMIHSNAPWVPTGYGQQCALLATRLAGLGHEVVISAFYGLNGSSTRWNGILVLPAGQDPYGSDIIVAHARHVAAELVITLMDIWVLDRTQIRELMTSGIPVAHWVPVDCDLPRRPDGKPDRRPRGLGKMDEAHLKDTGAIPVAMSKFGQRKLAEAGIRAHYVPHSVDTTVFTPPADRDALRRKFGLEGRFVVGVNQSNKDQARKGYPAQMLAFAWFREKHPEAVLSIHATRAAPGALNLDEITEDLGIADAVLFNDQYGVVTGGFTPESLAEWYGSLDLLSACAFGEGFGIPILEAQASGTPVVVTDASAMTELCGSGWKVGGEPFWNGAHRSWWTMPHAAAIMKVYEKAWAQAKDPGRTARARAKAREFALGYDADLVLARDWAPVLDDLAAARANRGRSPAPPAARERDTVTARLSEAWSAGVLDAGEFAERARKAMTAPVAELPALVAGLPAEVLAA